MLLWSDIFTNTKKQYYNSAMLHISFNRRKLGKPQEKTCVKGVLIRPFSKDFNMNFYFSIIAECYKHDPSL